ncbi:MAG: TetR/AcrR family transcriptional regulator, transcriptional repressor for nem operon [Miltoncostaeaceae bacterium]|nr:TetR/AcrR family transcriptional regulator, transcriptional repressor for nem operon [Miltoncostaeaceae bacterium]
MGRQSDARDRLIRSAGDLWHSRSYADVGVSEICEHAEVQKGSFYHFFASKRDLALAVIDDGWQRVGVGEIARIMTGPLPPLERLLTLMDRGIEVQMQLKEACGCTVGCSFGNLVVELGTVDEVLRERLARLFDDWAALIQHALDDAVDAGDLPQTDTGQTARAILAYIQGLGVVIKARDDPQAVADLGPMVLRLAGADPAAVARAAAGVTRTAAAV